MNKINYIFSVLLLSIITISANAQSWTQIGVNLNGENVDDLYGLATAINSDGSIVAVGSYKNSSAKGHVRVFQNISGTWTQMGADIDGDANGDNSGRAISMSSNGQIIAIGAQNNGGNGVHSGQVKVYQYNSGTSSWEQLGADIYGEADENYFGGSVSISADGLTFAASSPYNDDGGADAGQVEVYHYDGTIWEQVGADILGENIGDKIGTVSLSANGSGLAIGTSLNSDAGSYAGHVRIFSFDGTNWTQTGADIDGENASDYSANVDISDDGATVAIGARGNDNNGDASGYVRIFHYNGTAWTQVGTSIEGEAEGDWSGDAVSISSDASTVAIGAFRNNDGGDWAGHARIYHYNGTDWTQVGSDIDGTADNDGLGQSLALSGDATTIIVGIPRADNNGSNSGSAQVYNFTTLPSPTITSQPSNQANICINADVDFSVAGNDIENYQWKLSTDGTTWANITDNSTYSGAISQTLTVTVDASLDNNQYKCEVSNATGNTESDIVSLTIETENPTLTCVENQTINLTAGQTNYTVSGTEFDLTASDDNCGIASTINDFSNTETLAGAELPIGTTTISWTVTDNAGNTANCSFDVQVNAYVGIEDIENGISIYPNPTTGILNFDFKTSKGLLNIEITDITGKIINNYQSKINNSIDISNLTNGVYFIKIISGKNIITKKIIKI